MSWINKEGQNRNSDKEKNYPFARWMSWLFLLASILLLIYTYYRAEILFQGTRSVFYFKYYLISLTGIFFWGVVLRLQEGVRANIVTMAVSLVVGLYMVEGGLLLFGLGQDNRIPAIAAKFGIEYDTRTKLEVVEDLIEKKVDAVPTVTPSGFLHWSGVNKEDIYSLFPLGGVSNKTTVYNNESGKYLIYKSDRYGFNNPDSQWDSQTVEWLLTGDSFTQGSAVQPGEEIAGQIRSITGNHAISLGMGGNGPLMEYAALVEYGKTLMPAKVLWIYYENDLRGDFQRDKRYPQLMQYMEEGFSQNLIKRQKEIDSRLKEYIVSDTAAAKADALLYKAKWIRLPTIRQIINYDTEARRVITEQQVNNFDVNINDPLFVKILTKAKAEVEAWGGELYFIYLPEYTLYNNKGVSHDGFRIKSKVIEVVKGLKIPVIDIHQDAFAEHPDPLSLFPFRLKGHYNADGYKEVAKAIVRVVNKYEQSNK